MSRKKFNNKIWEALSNEKRRKIMDLLANGPRTTGEVVAEFKEISRCTVMLHMKVLEEADLIIIRRQGRYRWNYLNIEPIQRIYDRWLNQYAAPVAKEMVQLKDSLKKKD